MLRRLLLCGGFSLFLWFAISQRFPGAPLNHGTLRRLVLNTKKRWSNVQRSAGTRMCPGVLRQATTLRSEYHFGECPWMDLPTPSRYPRNQPKRRPPYKLWECFDKMWQWQQDGQILFILYEGQGLAAITGGGFHGNDDDDDLDMKMLSRLYPNVDGHCPGAAMGNWGFSPAPSVDNIGVGVRYKPIRLFGAALASPLSTSDDSLLREVQNTGCICRWEEFEVLCLNPEKSSYMRIRHGGSFWVPPKKGFKETGNMFKIFMQPGTREFPHFGWVKTTVRGLRLIDANSDGAISVHEFLTFLRNDYRVNQVWLSVAVANDPCAVANAHIHYNHTFHFGELAWRLRNDDDTDAQSDWDMFSRLWTDPPYDNDPIMCTKRLHGVEGFRGG